MLQQTTVATVTPRYWRFLERWPTVDDLAAAPLEEVLAEWAGLGYYARARNLHLCAKQVAALGGFPNTEARLRALPGIGDYTAAAIASIAFGETATVVDTNVERIVARLHAIPRPIKNVRPKIRALAADLFADGHAGDIAQALMDLGATICRPKAPRCDQCPLAAVCKAHASGTPEAYPPKPAKKDRPERHGTAWIIEQDEAIFLVRRPGKGLLGGMAALPGSDWQDGPPVQAGSLAVRHVFTHFALTLRLESRATPPDEMEGWWQPISHLDAAGLPTLYVKAIEAWRALEREAALIA
ncbi:MAG: A/G-specific adenine glycosylase [Sphingomonas sp.]|nr:A/G-specific adenine glycosylase [Sphingomonas sp.]RZV50085.1 MAG: A/G-specific adenine glycosylase [Sphingomonadaceae bacterium]